MARRKLPGPGPVGLVVVLNLTAHRYRNVYQHAPNVIAPGRIIVNPIRWIGDHQMRGGPVHESLHVRGVCAVTTQNPVKAPLVFRGNNPELAGLHAPLFTQLRALVEFRLRWHLAPKAGLERTYEVVQVVTIKAGAEPVLVGGAERLE